MATGHKGRRNFGDCRVFRLTPMIGDARFGGMFSALASAAVVAFVPTRDPDKARQFYENVLGLEFIADDAFALVFNSNGVTIRVVNVSRIDGFEPAPFTILGWNVSSVEAGVRQLAGKGVVFERFPGMSQDADGIWLAPGGARVAWFKDPDGNLLSISEA